jgi:hypothetical protein
MMNTAIVVPWAMSFLRQLKVMNAGTLTTSDYFLRK